MLPGVATVAYVDVDDTVKPTFGYAKQGAGRGYTGVKGLNALIGIISTPGSRPLIASARLRKGSANSARGAHRLVSDTLVTARSCGATGTLVLRADSAFFQSEVIAAALRAKACFSITARLSPPVRQAIEAIPAQGWTPIKYTNAVWDEHAQQWISEAEVAQIDYTAFTSRPKAKQVTARLIVRRVPDMNPAHQSPLFTVYRHHAVFTNSPLPMLDAEKAHRGHAIVEQVIADLKGGPLAHLPSGKFWANSAWLVCAAMAFNLTRTAGVLASPFHAKATTSTLRAQLINVPARLGSLRPADSPCTCHAAHLAVADRLEHPRHLKRDGTTSPDLNPTIRPARDRPGPTVENNRPTRPHNHAHNQTAATSPAPRRSPPTNGGSGLSRPGLVLRHRGRLAPAQRHGFRVWWPSPVPRLP